MDFVTTKCDASTRIVLGKNYSFILHDLIEMYKLSEYVKENVDILVKDDIFGIAKEVVKQNASPNHNIHENVCQRVYSIV